MACETRTVAPTLIADRIEMMKKTIGPTSANYYQALMKAIGLWETFYVTQDQFRSLGDSVCRMVYVRRSVLPQDTGVEQS